MAALGIRQPLDEMPHAVRQGKAPKEFTSNRRQNPLSITGNIYFAKVKSIVNDKNDGTIRVHIDNLDDNLPIDELPLCYPLMSRIIYSMSKRSV
jgi:hypothetical protein